MVQKPVLPFGRLILLYLATLPATLIGVRKALKGVNLHLVFKKVEKRALTCRVATNTDYYEMLLLLLLLMLLLSLIKLSLFIRVEHEQK